MELGRRWAFRWSTVIPPVVLTLVTLVVSAVRARSLPELLGRGDAIYDGLVARRLLAGDGFASNLVPLGALRTILARGWGGLETWPSVHKFVLSQARVAFFELIFRDLAAALRASSLTAYVAVVLLVYFTLAGRPAGRRIALGCAIALLCFDDLGLFGLSGLNITSDAVLWMAVVLAASRASRSPRAAWCLGILIALSTLHRYLMILALPVWLLGTWWAGGKKQALRVGAGAALLLVPFFAWTFSKYGMPFPSYLGDSMFLHRTKFLPYDPWYVASWPSLKASVLADPGAFGLKWINNFLRFFADLLRGPFGAARVILVGGLAVWGATTLRRWSERWVIAAGAAFVGGYLCFQFFMSASYAYSLAFLPSIWVLASIGLSDLLTRHLEARMRLAVAALVAAACVFVAPDVLALKYRVDNHLERLPQTDTYPDRDEINGYIRAHFPPKGLVIIGGNLPWEVAMATDNKVLSLVDGPDALDTLRGQGVVPDLVLLPSSLSFAGDGAIPPAWTVWGHIVAHAPSTFRGYRLEHTFASGTLLYANAHAEGPLPPLDWCSLVTRFELVHDGGWSSPFFGSSFRYVESHPDVGWRWLEGKTGRIMTVACGAARRLEIGYLSASPTTVSLEGQPIGVLPPSEEFTKVSLPLPRTVHDGVNALDFAVADVNAAGLSIAVSSVAFALDGPE